MKTMTHKWFYLVILFLLLGFEAKAYDFKVGEIYYKIYNDTAVQVAPGDVKYAGNITIPEMVMHAGKTYTVTNIGWSAFKSCTGLTSVTIPNSVTWIGWSAFDSCTGLTSITIPNSVTSISHSAFESCTGLTSIIIPNSVTDVGNSAFMNCTDLTSVTMSNNVTWLGSYAFSGCDQLTSITLPNDLTEIKDGTFAFCKRLSSVTIGNGVKKIGDSAFKSCSDLTSITLPNSLTEIGESAFYSTGLLSVTIPDNVSEIRNYTFENCYALTSVTIGSSVTDIGFKVFCYCGSLEIHCLATIPPKLDRHSFYSVPTDLCKLYVPYGRYNVYLNSDWSCFNHIYDGESSVNALPVSGVDIYGSKGNIVVTGAPVSTPIQIYSGVGQMVKSIHSVDDVTTIALSESGIYLVKIGNKSYKVRVL